MNFHNLTFFIAALVALFYLTEAGKSGEIIEDIAVTRAPPCARTCNKLFKCDPFYVSPVYSVINGVCRIFNNHCVFGTINCNRINQCLKPYEATTKEECQKACPRMCLMGGSGVCATFYYFNNKGVRIEVKRSFENQCILDSYCCATDTAYMDVTEGFCP